MLSRIKIPKRLFCSHQRVVFRKCVNEIPPPNSTLTSAVVWEANLKRTLKQDGYEDLSPIQEDSKEVCNLLDELNFAHRVYHQTRAKRSEVQSTGYQDFVAEHREQFFFCFFFFFFSFFFFFFFSFFFFFFFLDFFQKHDFFVFIVSK